MYMVNDEEEWSAKKMKEFTINTRPRDVNMKREK